MHTLCKVRTRIDKGIIISSRQKRERKNKQKFEMENQNCLNLVLSNDVTTMSATR